MAHSPWTLLSATALLAATAFKFSDGLKQCDIDQPCKLIVECAAFATAEAIRSVRPQPCGFSGRMPLVCCPGEAGQVTTPSPPALTNLLPTECGDPDRFLFDNIVPSFCQTPGVACAFNGVDAERGKWPWMALLGQLAEDGSFGEWFCGGTLITDRHVLTAAHCLRPQQVGSVGVRLGDHDLSTELDVHHQERNISAIIRHPDFSGAQNDIALVRLEQPVSPSPTIRPICLPPPGAEHADREVDMAGFGYLEFAGALPDVLQEVPLRVSDVQACERAYSALPQFESRFRGGFQGTKVCALSRDETPRDACPGDSGGPLMAERTDGLYELVGVVSTGVGCGNPDFPGIYTKVSAYVDWILANLT